ncbi:chemotaxis protein CheW [Alteromonas sp. a30]|uniref:chemotaxis protein CheW n=1 Tax=Alteromonas sp. a30 TaxID=2730917 RepID=UPI002281FFEE|nr:chemotaxis protein CheW [Alteromonas sp. a30]MCY7295374.1 purine-binding chemotaxis protein CheW [Alteromonas sp. a30]
MNQDDIQLLCVTLSDEQYGLNITKVQEIRALGKHRRLPNMPKHCVGVIDFRNTMVPVIDLREMFAYAHSDISSQTVIVVMSIENKQETLLIGVVVDSVSDVISVEPTQVKHSPTLGTKVDTSFIQGMFKYNDHIIIILTLESILEEQELSELNDMVITDSTSA